MGFFQKLKLKTFKGFKPEDFEPKTKIELYNGSLFTEDQLYEYEKYSINKKSDFLLYFIKSFPNYKYLTDSVVIIVNSIINEGHSISSNPFLEYIINIDSRLKYEDASYKRKLCLLERNSNKFF